MAEPQIQYAKTSDGVSIAYSTLGEGGPLIYMPNIPWSHLELEWRSPLYRGWYERLASSRMLVRYDGRGAGLSDRKTDDYSIDAHVRDLEAIVRELRLPSTSIYAPLHAGPIAITYAVRHPERVSHLGLYLSYARAADYLQTAQGQTLASLRDKDWQIYTETAASVMMGWSAEEPARRLAELMREGGSPEALLAFTRAFGALDVSELLPRVRMPCLVVHLRGFGYVDIAAARYLAAGIPNARLTVFEGEHVFPSQTTMDEIAKTIDEFLTEGHEPEPKAELPEGMAVILFADIVESTALTEQLGDAAFRKKARQLDEALRRVIGECSGTPVEGKVLGDGVLAVFTSARHAIEAALRCGKAGEEAGLQLHLGIHAGDVIREGNNVYGGAVNIAARIAGASAAGEVLVSDTVRSLARTSAGVSFDDRGEHALKGVADPQRLFAVRGGG